MISDNSALTISNYRHRERLSNLLLSSQCSRKPKFTGHTASSSSLPSSSQSISSQSSSSPSLSMYKHRSIVQCLSAIIVVSIFVPHILPSTWNIRSFTVTSALPPLTIDDSFFDEQDHLQSLPRFIARSYPEFPALALLNKNKKSTSNVEPDSEPHNQIRHRRHHNFLHHRGFQSSHRRERRQFHFSSPNISLGYGSLSEVESGPWAPWSELSECTRSCGGGVHYQTRQCMDRLSQSCIGPSKRYFSCNVHDCQSNAQDFRENQCSRFDSLPFEGQYYNWIPYTRGRNPCELNCMPIGGKFYVRQARKVIDGTRCYANETTDICVDGVCVELGCDRILGSGAREDKCRRCNGDGSTCRTIEGMYAQSSDMQAGYNDILIIPEGATNIEIRETKQTNNYLAVRNLAGVYHLNGDWHIQQPGTFQFAGSKWQYTRPRSRLPGPGAMSADAAARFNVPETLRSDGPTSEALFIVLLYQEQNQGVTYEYSVPFNVHQPAGILTAQQHQQVSTDTAGIAATASISTKYAWIFGDYSACSRSCGTGIQRRDVFCATINSVSGKQEPVREELCDPTSRPTDSRPCTNENACSAQWYTGQWSICSCVYGVQHRSVFCTAGEVTPESTAENCPILPDSSCTEVGQRPAAVKKCIPSDVCPQWIASEWTECDSRCGQGMHNRTVKCGYPAKKKTMENEMSAAVEASSRTGKSIKDEDSDDIEQGLSIQKRETVTETEAPITFAPSTIGYDITITVQSESAKSVPDSETAPNLESKTDHITEENDIYVDDWQCDPETRPAAIDQCFKMPCDEIGSVEWIVSTWSSCDSDCGSQISTRKVACATSGGEIFDDEICAMIHGADSKPATTQTCTDAVACSKSFWFVAADWSPCSASCGSGIKTRHVFCAHIDETTGKMVPEFDSDGEIKCDPALKPATSEACVTTTDQCVAAFWLAGPLRPCTVPCGGGTQTRPLFCIVEMIGSSRLALSDQCAPSDQSSSSSFSKSEQCNIGACDEEQTATIIGCKDTTYGCCSTDWSTPADEDLRNCPTVDTNVDPSGDVTLEASLSLASEASACESSRYGCCHGVSRRESLGPFGLGCPINCNNTRFGCCSDMITVANSADYAGCPIDELPTTTTTTTPAPTTTTFIPDVYASIVKISNCSSDEVEGSGGASECSQSISMTESSPGISECSKSRFGCCPDGWTTAEGPDGDGCEDGSGDGSNIITTTISSMLNTVISTILPTSTAPPFVIDSDDCALTQFGCCPNGKTKALGERYYGCTCEDYPYGCCQDRYTPAGGENYEGCYCNRTLYGCCADGVTPAIGENQQGCNCESSTFGCCSDMVTFARGPNLFNCPCDTLIFGCCPGSTIPAKGPNFAGCTCADSPFGCCADGVTVAYGPNFEGCPSGPSLDLKLASEVCALPMDIGPCRNFSVKWYFDVSYGSCNRFWYGGCEGNGNRFSSQELCERACVKPEGPERCSLPKIGGPCNSSQVMYYYDANQGRCDRFMYGGCLGNTNRFEKLQECEESCVNQVSSLTECEQPVSPGPCRGNYRRWYYRKEEGRCREFLYGGCQGNQNNFQSESECQAKCNERKSPFEICAQPKAAGRCLGTFPRWHFDQQAGTCRDFVYSGCEGNNNRFVDRESCERTCNVTISYHYQPHVPQPPTYPAGTAHQQQAPIHLPPVRPTAAEQYESVCALPKQEGPCHAMVIQWYFNSYNRRCEQFYYGGCGGNANRFDHREACEQRCIAPPSEPISSDPCLEQNDSGSCSDYSERFYYDVEDRRCHRFYYSGCGGNRNNFATVEECSARCERPREAPTSSTTESTIAAGRFDIAFCFKDFDSGPCHNMNQIQWYYNRRDGVCKEFLYGGCAGNENRFDSQYECQTKCWNSQDICKLPSARGSCSANFTQWFFDYQANECFEFQFSGCHGNANRFSSRDDCKAQCGGRGAIDHDRRQGSEEPYDPNQIVPPTSQFGTPSSSSRSPIYPPSSSPSYSSSHDTAPPVGTMPSSVNCSLPREPGPCRGYFPRWYYSAEDGQCRTFIYGGCEGNENRYQTFQECESVCRPRQLMEDGGPREGFDQRDVVCRMPLDAGPCTATRARWFFDAASHTCLPFGYGGCGGNKNRFRSYEECIGFCGGLQSSAMHTPLAPQPQIPQQPQSPPYSAFPPHSAGHHPQPPYQQPPYQQPPTYQQPLYPQPPYQQPPPYQPQQPSSPPESPQAPDDCETVECREEHCLLGIDYFRDSRGCPSCRCTNPCNDLQCPDDMSCALELYRDENENNKARGHAECRLRKKPGSCPAAVEVAAASASISGAPNGTNCIVQCRSDADCRGADKCCNNGCADICYSPFGDMHIMASHATYGRRPTVVDMSGQSQSHLYQGNVAQQHHHSQLPSQSHSSHSQSQHGASANAGSDGSSYHSQSSSSTSSTYYNQQIGGQGGNNIDGASSHDTDEDEYDEDVESPISLGGDTGGGGGVYSHSTSVMISGVNDSSNSIPEIHVTVRSGEDAVLDCHVVGESNEIDDATPASVVTSTVSNFAIASAPVLWSRDGREIGSIVDSSRFEIFANGSLVLRKTDFNDHGTYACVSSGPSGLQETGYVRLQIEAPVRILPGPTNVIAQLGAPAMLQCNAVGYPDPKITWYKGDRALHPNRSNKYRQFANSTLLIGRVSVRDRGVYTCNAFNGIGLHALWDVTLLLDLRIDTAAPEPEIVPYPSINGQMHSSHQHGHGVPNRVVGYLDRISAQIELNPQEYRVGSTVTLRCVVRSAITNEVVNPSLLSAVTWFINSDIPLSIGDVNRHHYRLSDGNSSLLVHHMTKSDSGEYRCRANTGPHADSMASIHIHVDNIYVPPHCQDSPRFKNCDMIVGSNYCRNPVYQNMCCRSCYIANLADRMDPIPVK